MSSLFEAGRDSEATLQGVVNLFVPAFADWCAVDVIDEGGNLRRINAASLAFEGRRKATDEVRALPSRSFADFVQGLLDNREGAVIVEIDDIAQLPWTPAEPEVTELIASQIPLSMIFAPLRAHGTRLGSLHVGRANGVRRFVPADAALVDEVAQRSAFALQTAQLVEALERELALRETATTALAESEARYRDLFRASPFPLLVHDVETKQILAVNDAAVAQYGFTEKEFLARTLIDIRPPEDVEQVKEVLSEKSTGPRVLQAYRHRRKDETVFLVEVSSQSITFGGRAARITHAQDITER
ncbi:MAG: PAS domain S-box protein, partial [Gemmatimonadaceae bacterium]